MDYSNFFCILLLWKIQEKEAKLKLKDKYQSEAQTALFKTQDRDSWIVYAFVTYWTIAQNEAEGPSVLKPTEKDPTRFSNSTI